MTVTSEQAALLKDSLHTLRGRLEPASMSFYEALFRRAPGLRAMFRDDLAGQGMKFMSTLRMIVGAIDQPEGLATRYKELGQGHALMGVKAEHFAPMGDALIETLRLELGEDFTPTVEAAWRAAYAELSARIIGAGDIG